jgi:hypothetical protein
MALFLSVVENVGHHALGMALPLSGDGDGEKWQQHYLVQTVPVNLFLQLIWHQVP